MISCQFDFIELIRLNSIKLAANGFIIRLDKKSGTDNIGKLVSEIRNKLLCGTVIKAKSSRRVAIQDNINISLKSYHRNTSL